jgi:hypothetical protein
LLLFPKLKESLAGKTFSDDDEVQDAVMTWLREQAGDFYDAGIKNSLDYCFFFTFPSSGILETRKHDVSETGSVSILR